MMSVPERQLTTAGRHVPASLNPSTHRQNGTPLLVPSVAPFGTTRELAASRTSGAKSPSVRVALRNDTATGLSSDGAEPSRVVMVMVSALAAVLASIDRFCSSANRANG